MIMKKRGLAPGPGDALIVVDAQVDFLPGGSLAVPGGDEVVPVLNRCIELFHARELPVYFTRDWHPADHVSFREQGGPWPPHCVQGTQGAGFAPGLDRDRDDQVISKADNSDRDSYSNFEETDLKERLRYQKVRRVFVGGLATDYCVLNTVGDALKEGFEAVLLVDAIRAVNVKPGDGERAVRKMVKLGAREARYPEISA
jgi:nicotinamidase/pyrazinamidase